VQNVDADKSETKVRVFRLLYLTYGISLKVLGESLFEEEFWATNRGPVAVDAHASWNWDGIGAKDPCPRDKEFCDQVLSQFEGETVHRLEEMCCHTPWKNVFDDKSTSVNCLNENEIRKAFGEIPHDKVLDLLEKRRAGAHKFHQEFKKNHPHLFSVEI
jgi:hypothetical protein